MEEQKKRPWYSVKISSVIALFMLILLVGFSIDMIYVAFEYWVTPGERKAAILALGDIDQVRNREGLDQSTYEARLAKAEQSVKKADSAAFTARDHAISFLLELDFSNVKFEKGLWSAPDEVFADKLATNRSVSGHDKKLKLLAQENRMDQESDTTIKLLLGIREHK